MVLPFFHYGGTWKLHCLTRNYIHIKTCFSLHLFIVILIILIAIIKIYPNNKIEPFTVVSTDLMCNLVNCFKIYSQN
jgi:hypothetical protein